MSVTSSSCRFSETAAPLWQYPNPCRLKLIPYKTELRDRLLSTAFNNIESLSSISYSLVLINEGQLFLRQVKWILLQTSKVPQAHYESPEQHYPI